MQFFLRKSVLKFVITFDKYVIFINFICNVILKIDHDVNILSNMVTGVYFVLKYFSPLLSYAPFIKTHFVPSLS
jgi:hypothetical protein